MMKIIRPEQLAENTFKMIGTDKMLITTCTKSEDEEGNILTGRVNTTTASWGGLGILWNRNIATIYLRPNRYTKELLDNTDSFSLNVLSEKYKNVLDYCESHSGRTEDKIKQCKLNVEYMNFTPWIKQAHTVIFCRKIYAQEIDPNCFTDELFCKKNYRKDDFHTMYIAEILKVMVDQQELKKKK